MAQLINVMNLTPIGITDHLRHWQTRTTVDLFLEQVNGVVHKYQKRSKLVILYQVY
jgi:hypothetical protein